MNKTAKKLLALFLALMLALSLAACEKSGDDKDKEHDGVTPVVDSPKDDPAGYLAMAIENTTMDLMDRCSGSPLAAVARAMDTNGRLSVSGSLQEEGISVDLKELSLSYDLDKKTLLLDLDAVSQELEFKGGVVLCPDFLGISFPMFFGDDAYYGFEPKNLEEQLTNSPLIDLMGGEADLNEADLAQLDELLDLLWDAKPIDTGSLREQMGSLAGDFWKDVDVSFQEGAVQVEGKDVDGYIFTARVTAKDLQGAMEKIYDILLEMPIWDTLSKAAQIGGEALDMDQLRSSLDESLAQFGSSDLAMDITFYVADGKAVYAESSAASEGAKMDMTIRYYDDGGITCEMSSGGDTVKLVSKASSSGGKYRHDFSFTAGGETLTLAAQWDGSALSLDMSVPGTGNTSLSCGLTAAEGGFTVTEPRVSGGVQDISLPLTVRYTSGGAVSAPVNTKNVLKMSEAELEELLGPIFQIIGSAQDDQAYGDSYDW